MKLCCNSIQTPTFVCLLKDESFKLSFICAGKQANIISPVRVEAMFLGLCLLPRSKPAWASLQQLKGCCLIISIISVRWNADFKTVCLEIPNILQPFAPRAGCAQQGRTPGSSAGTHLPREMQFPLTGWCLLWCPKQLGKRFLLLLSFSYTFLFLVHWLSVKLELAFLGLELH